MSGSAELKEKLVNRCTDIVQEKLVTVDRELELIQKSSNEETKSSAGDKYETGRAMLMLEKEKLIGQKQQLLQQLKPLKSIDVRKECGKVELGAVVLTSQGNYFVSTGLGSIDVDEDFFFVVSAMSPIVQAMLNKEKGDFFEFNKKRIEILEIL